MRRRTLLRAGAGAVTVPFLGRTVSGQESRYGPTGSVDIEGAREAAVHHDGDVAYVAASDGLAAVNITEPSEPTVLAERRDIDTGSNRPLLSAWEVWPSEDRLILAGPANFRTDSAQGFALFDISDPAAPEQVAFYSTNFHIHNAFFTDGMVYLVGSGDSAQPVVMVDVSDDDPTEVGRWSPVEYDKDWSEVPVATRVLHDVYVQDGIGYLVYWDAGTWVVDLSDPGEPEVLSRFGDYSLDELLAIDIGNSTLEGQIPPGNAHYSVVNDDGTVLAVGKESWAVEGPDGLVGGASGVELWDISDKTEPTQLATIEAPESYGQTTGDRFTTAHNCDIADGRLYTSWYYGGVKIHDISDPANPEELAWWRNPSETSFWTAQSAVSGDTFIASSANLGAAIGDTSPEARDALYTFPDRAGSQENPPDLTERPEGVEPPSPTPTPTEGASTPTAEPSAGLNGGSQSTTFVGIGVGTILAGLGLGAWYQNRDK